MNKILALLGIFALAGFGQQNNRELYDTLSDLITTVSSNQIKAEEYAKFEKYALVKHAKMAVITRSKRNGHLLVAATAKNGTALVDVTEFLRGQSKQFADETMGYLENMREGEDITIVGAPYKWDDNNKVLIFVGRAWSAAPSR